MPRWVTVFRRVNHLGVEPGTQAYSARACPGWNEYPAKAGEVNRISHDTTAYTVVSQCSLNAWLYRVGFWRSALTYGKQ